MERNKQVKAVVSDYGVEITSKMISILKQHGSKELYNQIDQKIIEDMNLVMLEISMPESATYASEGRSAGKFPPLASIKVWMRERSINLAALYPIAIKIASLGTKASASHFLNEFKITSEFETDLFNAYQEDVKDALIEYVNILNQGK